MPPFRIDDGNPLGRVDIELEDDGIALVSWLEHVGDGAEIRLARVTHRGELSNSVTAGECEASRQSGFPVLESIVGGYLLTWTGVNDKTAVVSSMLQLR